HVLAALLSHLIFISRPPPTSTLFPYTTLFRSHHRAEQIARHAEAEQQRVRGDVRGGRGRVPVHEQLVGDIDEAQRPAQHEDAARSEEHTSELQSLAYLVCRLLLEKKKQHNQLI